MATTKPGRKKRAKAANLNGNSSSTLAAHNGSGEATDALRGFGPALLKDEPTATSATDSRVSAAFALGWHMSELYEKHLAANGQDPPDLPGLGALSRKKRIAVLIDQVEVGSNRLAGPIAEAGLSPVDLTALNGVRRAKPEEDPVLAAHKQLLGELTAADFRLGKAYGLGRALADSCQEPTDVETLRKEVDPHRIANLLRWLDDLESAFPPHAASSVKKSLEKWRDALYPPASAAGSPAAVAATPDAERETVKALRRQGELWRALLTGEKQGTDMLEIDNYLDATRELVSRMAAIARGAVRRMPGLSLLIVLLVLGGLALFFVGGTAQLVGGVTSILAALGLAWKGLGGALGRLVGRLEEPLWGAVLDDAIADSITLLPDNNAENGGRRQVALTVSRAAGQAK